MKTMKENFTPNHLFFLLPKLLKLLVFVIIFGQQKNFSISKSLNTTITKTSQFSSKEDVGQPLKDISKDVSLRKSLPGCGGIFTVQPGDYSFRILSPDYPLPYPALLDCIYDIRFGRGLFPCYVVLRFENFYLASNPPDCYGDRLEVGSKRLCGSYSGSEIFETEWAPDGRKHLVLRLVTDQFGTERGFSICVSPIPCIGLPPYPSPPHIPPLLPPPTRPPIYPPIQPPWYPPYKPNPIPPLYPPPSPSIPSIPFCCGTQYQGRHIYISSPGFPYELLSGIDCGYVINRLSPRITHLRIKFKYFFLPCPWAHSPEIGVHYPQSSKGYLSVNGRHFCGCQTGLSVLIPFGRFERIKFLRLYSPSFYSQSRSSDRNGSSLINLNNTSSVFPDVRKTSSSFQPSPTDVFLSGISENSQHISKNDQTNSHSAEHFNRSFSVIFPSSDVQFSQDLGDSDSNSQNANLQKFHISKQTDATSFPLPRLDKSFTSSPYHHFRVAPFGFLLEISQVEIPYLPGKRRGKDVIDGEETDLLEFRSENISLPDVQSASSRSFNLPTQGCRIDDLPWIRWWIWMLRKKNLLQDCPAVSRPPWSPYYPYPPPSNCGPFVPTSGVQN